MRNVLADYVRKLPIDLRAYILPFIYGLFGGLAAVAFQKLAGINPKSLQNATFACGIPLPAASRLTKVRIRPAMIDAARIAAKLKSAKVPDGICWDGFSQSIENRMPANFWNATAARPPNNP